MTETDTTSPQANASHGVEVQRLVSRLCARIGSDEVARLLAEVDEHLGKTQNKKKLKRRASNLNVYDSTDSMQFAGG